MLLSDAIALGRTLVCRLRAGGTSATDAQPGDGCVLDMAALAVGRRGWIDARDEWPWLDTPGTDGYDYLADIYTRFDVFVMQKKSMTLDELIDWIRRIEPAEPAPAAAEQQVAETVEVRQSCS